MASMRASPTPAYGPKGSVGWVWLKGCVRRKDQAEALVKLVRRIDDVEAVIDELIVEKRK
jgi:osmotically-inducible protein OsmY